ncbi:mercury resistance system periplasmic binding protein MerP [Zobellella aerophila]|uniref:Periplasmic mercury ion-binding protein n=1 Tax=Zobellella aerophila TaxID=870480 RepID=A0ABP6VJW7_9GAMM
MKKRAAFVVLTAALSAPVWAAMQTIKLSVPGMTCSACPITVKLALSKVDGVATTDVSFEERLATVTFDDTKTTVEALAQATENAGYPASLLE